MKNELIRTEGNVFVSVAPPTPVKQVTNAKRAYNDWQTVGQRIASDLSVPEPTPTLDEVFAQSVPSFIKASRWGKYIEPNPESSIFDNVTYLYHEPCGSFWKLYEMARGIFRDLGIRVSKQRGRWVAHLPIECLTDKVFRESGLASVARMLEETSVNPSEMLKGLRQRQSAEAHEGVLKVKRNRQGVA